MTKAIRCASKRYQLLLWQSAEMASDTFRDAYQALEVKPTNLATPNAEHRVSHTHVSRGIRTPVTKALWTVSAVFCRQKGSTCNTAL